MWLISWLISGRTYKEGRGWRFTAGSRAEGLALEDKWGHPSTDWDCQDLFGRQLGVFLPGSHREQGHSCLSYRPEGCPAAYTKLEISDISSLRKEHVWWEDYCVHKSSGRQWLNTHNMVRIMTDSDGETTGFGDEQIISGPAAQSQQGSFDRVSTLVCCGPHPNLEQEFRLKPRGQWPPPVLINYILQLPILLVLVGHKFSPDRDLLARLSWSVCELKLTQGLPESVKQGYIACKYVLKRFLAAHRGQNIADDGRSCVGSYHIKTVFLHFLEKVPPVQITSPFRLFLDLLDELDHCLETWVLPHYFLPQCNLLETVGAEERCIARRVIQVILSDPLTAIITSPTDFQQICGEAQPNDLVTTLHKFLSCPRHEQSRKDLSVLLACMDKRRQQTYSDQKDSDRDEGVSGRPELISLVDTLHQIQG